MTDAMHVPNVERALICGLLRDPSKVFVAAEHVRKQDFESTSCGVAWVAIKTLIENGGVLDRSVMIDLLTSRAFDKCEDVAGWNVWVLDVEALGASAAHVKFNAATVARAALARELHRQLDTLKGDLAGLPSMDHPSFDSYLDENMTRLRALVDRTRTTVDVDSLSVAGPREAANLVESGVSTGIPTGFDELDALTHGMRCGEMTTVAAYTARGKSTLALQIAMNVASTGRRVLVFCLEMSISQIVQRMICNLSGLSMDDVYHANERVGAADAIGCAGRDLAKLSIDFCPEPTLTAQQLVSFARTKKEHLGVDLVVVDYMQLVRDPKAAESGRVFEVSAVSRALKRMGLALGIPVLSVAQLSRAAATDEPQLHHLRESGAIEQDSDCVLLLSQTPEDDSENMLRVRVAKNRQGPCDVVRLAWSKPRFKVSGYKPKIVNLSSFFPREPAHEIHD